MIEFVKRYGYNVYSQNNEDGIIDECIKRGVIKAAAAYEVGAPTKDYCSNIYNLFKQGWVCGWVDCDPQEKGIKMAFITPENVNEIIKINDSTVLSIDIDGNDYAVWKAYKGKPAIVIIEINSSLDPDVEFFHPERGASYIAMLRLGEEKGYFLLCHTGNMIFVDNAYKHLFPEIGDPYDYEKFFDKKWLQKEIAA